MAFWCPRVSCLEAKSSKADLVSHILIKHPDIYVEVWDRYIEDSPLVDEWGMGV
jgi:hypothetical protein